MADLTIKSPELDEWIKVLEDDNQQLYDCAMRMVLNIRNLDDTKYSGNHKKQIEAKLHPYLKKIEDELLNNLNDCTEALKVANSVYTGTEETLSTESDKLHS